MIYRIEERFNDTLNQEEVHLLILDVSDDQS